MNAYCQRAGKDLSEVRFMVGTFPTPPVLHPRRARVIRFNQPPLSRFLDGVKLTPNQLVSDVRTKSLLLLLYWLPLSSLTRSPVA
jgi:hypothetical protein